MGGWYELLGELAAGALRSEHLAAAVLVLARMLPVVAFTPVFGGAVVPRRLRFAMALLFAIALVPVALQGKAAGAVADASFAALLLREAGRGVVLAVVVRVLFEVLAASGAIIDLSRGASIAMVFDPVTQRQAPVLATWLGSVFVALFAAAGGLRMILRGFAEQLRLQPLGTPWLGAEPPGHAVAALLASTLACAVQLAMPVIVLLLLLDLALGLLNRFAPQVQVFFLSMTVKATLGIAIVLLCLPIIAEQFLARVFDVLEVWLRGGS